MNSIHANQPEDMHQDLAGSEAVAKIKQLAGKAHTCFFCTAAPFSAATGARPMNVRKVDDNGDLWFLSASDSHLNQEVADDPHVRLFFQGSPHSDFMEIKGYAHVSRDKAKIEELWEPLIKTWFTEGVDDPRITVIKVSPSTGYYWDTKHGHAVAGIKMMIGALTGKTLDDSIEGKLSV
jgi:general stress protein 26